MKQIYCKVIFTLLISLVVFTINAQNIEGVVLNEQDQPLSGVTITIDGIEGGKITDENGKFSWLLKPSIYQIHFSMVGYKTTTLSSIQVHSSKSTPLKVKLFSNEELLAVAKVSASTKKETVNSVIHLQRRSSNIADAISAEVIKKSPDKTSSDVLKRVSGTSIQDNKFVVVRGLIDRYNIALLNNSLLPSSEPDRRAFSFDIIPSQLLDNIFIYKTATPDLPGDFAGGLIQISTKDVPNENYLQIGGGISYNTLSTGKPFQIGYVGSKDYLGFENGDRKLPSKFPTRKQFQSLSFSDRANQTARFKNTYGNRYHDNALPNQSYQITWGKKIITNNDANIGSILSLNYRNNQTLVTGIRTEYDNQFESVNGSAYKYEDSTYKFTTALGVLWNLSYKHQKNKITWRNLANHVFENSNLIRTGQQYYSGGALLTAQGTEVVAKTLVSSQLEGLHNWKNKTNLNWNLHYAFVQRDHPDYKFAPFIKDSSFAAKELSPTVILRDTYRFFAKLQEHAIGANVQYSSPLKINQNEIATIKFGLFTHFKLRNFNARIFRYNKSPQLGFNEDILSENINNIFSKSNMHSNGLALEEITNNTDQYEALTIQHAGYVMLDQKITERFKLIWGLRVEQFSSVVNTADFSGSKVKVNRSFLDFLPSLNASLSINEISNIRFAVSRTVARPELREMANFSFYDFIRNVQVRGNMKLTRSQHTNIDIRYEVYPNNGELFSITAFYKHFKNPIELRVDPGSNPLSLVFEYYNANKATSYGLEAEIRKRLSFLGDAEWLNDFTVFANAAIIKSKIDVRNLDMAVADFNRPMQGQSPYLLNGGFTYAHPTKGWSVSTMVNRIGHRIEAVGNDPKGLPDIYENGRTVIDFQVSKKIFKQKGELKINISDLLNQSIVFYQNYRMDTDKISRSSYNKNEDRIWSSAKFGSSYGLSFTYQF